MNSLALLLFRSLALLFPIIDLIWLLFDKSHTPRTYKMNKSTFLCTNTHTPSNNNVDLSAISVRVRVCYSIHWMITNKEKIFRFLCIACCIRPMPTFYLHSIDIFYCRIIAISVWHFRLSSSCFFFISVNSMLQCFDEITVRVYYLILACNSR